MSLARHSEDVIQPWEVGTTEPTQLGLSRSWCRHRLNEYRHPLWERQRVT
jgi:hypothetical protein